MKKKEYLKPTMQVVEIDVHTQILAGSVTSVTSTGLDGDLGLPDAGDATGDAWNDAMSRQNVWNDDVEGDW